MWNKCAYHVMAMPGARVIMMKKADLGPVSQSLSSRAELFKVQSLNQHHLMNYFSSDSKRTRTEIASNCLDTFTALDIAVPLKCLIKQTWLVEWGLDRSNM